MQNAENQYWINETAFSMQFKSLEQGDFLTFTNPTGNGPSALLDFIL